MKSEKAQAAFEFLMTYGWALLVALVAISALIYFGVLNPKSVLPEKCVMFPGFTCIDAYATLGAGVGSAAQIRLTFQNGLGYDMNFGKYNDGVTSCDTCGIDVAVAGNLLGFDGNPPATDCTAVDTWTGTLGNKLNKDSTIVCGYRATIGVPAGSKFDGVITVTWLDQYDNLRTKTGTLSLFMEA